MDDNGKLSLGRYVFLIGGGGKTSLMFALANRLESEGRTVLTTTSTKIYFPAPGQSGRVLVERDLPSLVVKLKQEFAARKHVTAASSVLPGTPEKLCGFSAEQLDSLRDAGVADCILVEADGSAGRSLKAHEDYEPVISPRAEQVIVVIGVDCLGQPMTDEYVHRAALFCERLGRKPGAIVTEEDVAGILFHPEGYLRKVGEGSRVTVVISKVADSETELRASDLAKKLREHDRKNRIDEIVWGSLL